ncbi:MAG: alanine--tRNA ligase, partial [Chlamydiae bacterium]|nr:alanine--tRNA ligase [Chlamydiota bacterium]
MQSQELRRKFLHFFREKGHTIVPSSPVVPHDDPSILFTNAGMNQFKKIFLGQAVMPYTRASTTQKCVRVGGKHNDLDNVGFTSRHLTFFEMLGNFSFGDYFKKEAIAYAWELSTRVLELEESKIWVTVFEKDDEAYELWKQWVPEKRIVRLGEKDNFWAMGDTGPCGPCSELLYDRGDLFGNATSPLNDVDGERFFEFWNLVFMQFNRDFSGKMAPLPKQNIDTGMGLERLVSLKLGVNDVFQTDILRSLIAQVENISGKTYKSDPAFHVVADHIRSLSFAIADGAQPGNVERGYVLRKILRRAVRYGRTLGLQKPFLGQVADRLFSLMGEDFPELISAKDKIKEILYVEEENFIKTLSRGGNILQTIIDNSKKSESKQISGQEAFRLKDTYGFPLDELLLIAKDNGLNVNLEAFNLLEEEAKERSRASQKELSQEAKVNLFEGFVKKHGTSSFVGYDTLETEGSITGIFQGVNSVERISEGESALIILDKTSFYAEMGGQIGDTGLIVHNDAIFSVEDTTQPFTGVI